MASIDKESVSNAYEDVRSDTTDTNWVMFRYEGKDIVVDSTGIEYQDFLAKLTEDERAFCFIRMTTGDELSKRVKFVLASWVGKNVSPMKKAKMFTDKGLLKTVVKSFAIEITSDDLEELSENNVLDELRKVGGANYGTGVAS